MPGWEGLNLDQSGRWEGSRGPRGQPFGPKQTINSPPLHPLCTLYCDVRVEEKMKDNWGAPKCSSPHSSPGVNAVGMRQSLFAALYPAS